MRAAFFAPAFTPPRDPSAIVTGAQRAATRARRCACGTWRSGRRWYSLRRTRGSSETGLGDSCVIPGGDERTKALPDRQARRRWLSNLDRNTGPAVPPAVRVRDPARMARAVGAERLAAAPLRGRRGLVVDRHGCVECGRTG